jgi:hypothetical protein
MASAQSTLPSFLIKQTNISSKALRRLKADLLEQLLLKLASLLLDPAPCCL